MRLTAAEIGELLATRPIHRNTLQNDEVVFLRTAAETGGECTLLHVQAEPGSGVTRHYHQTYTERFEVREGVLSVEAGGTTQVLMTGETATAPKGTVHRWANQTSRRTRFLVEATPASEGFEKGLQILYGLASDGLTFSNGVPRNVLHTAWLMEYSDIWLPRTSRPLVPLLRALAEKARAQGIDEQLLDRYCS